MNSTTSEQSSLIDLVKNYNLDLLVSDLLAALSVAAIALPQNMAYALIIGINPIYGIYTSIVSMVISTIIGNSRYIVVGPTNMLAMAIASNLSFIAAENYLATIFLLTFMVGVFQFLFGLFKLGDLVTYVSHPVIVGLSTGAAFLIGSGQLQNLLGLSVDGGINFFTELYAVVTNLGATNYLTLGMGLFTILVIVGLQKYQPELPSYLIALGLSTFIVYLFGLESNLETVGSLPRSILKFRLFPFDLELIRQLLGKSISIALLGLIQTVAIAKSLADRADRELQINQEFISQGITNMISSFFSCFASAPSFTNSFANYQSGAKTKLSQFFVALTIILFILLLSPIVKYMPIVGLASLVIVVAYGIIEPDEIKKIVTTTQVDAVIFTITFITAIVMPSLDYAIYFGVLASMVVLLKESRKASVEPIRYEEEEEEEAEETLKWDEIDKLDQDETEHNCLVINLSGNLHFSTAEDLKEKLDKVYPAGENFVIRLRDIEQIDVTVVKELEKFIIKVKGGDGEITLAGVNEDNYEVLERYGIISELGDEKVFKGEEELLDSTKEAVKATNNKQKEKED